MSEKLYNSRQEIFRGEQGLNTNLTRQEVVTGCNPEAGRRTIKLDELENGQAGVIVSIDAKTRESSEMLADMEISPQAIVRMIDNYSSYLIFRVDHRKFAADKKIGAEIFVQPF